MGTIVPSPDSRELSLHEVQLPDAGKTITVDGRHYRMLGEEAKIRLLQERLPPSDIPVKKFDAVLLTLGMQDFASAKTNALGSQIIIRPLSEPERSAATAMNSLLEQEVKEHDFRGAVLVVHNGKPILMKGFGPASASGKPNTEETLFELGSITKQFTAVAIMQLIEQGAIASLDDKISKYLPPRYANNPIWKDITIRQLLTHSSGIPNIPPPDAGVPFRYSPDDILSLFQDLPLEFEPGTHFHYSNSGYDVLGRIIECVSGQRYDEFLEKNIFAPLGMRSTVAGNSADIEHCAQGFERKNEGGEIVVGEVLYHASHLSKAYSAGNMLSSVEDLSRWDAGLYRDSLLSKENRDKLFLPELNLIFFPQDPHWHIDELTLPTLFTEGDKPLEPPKTSYALGWRVSPEVPDAGLVHEHGGSIPGFNTYILRYPETKSCIVVLTNLVDYTRKGDDGAGDLAMRLEECLLKIPREGKN